MENWVLLGLLAALAYGMSGLLTKVASGPNYFGMEPRMAGLLVATGIAATFAVYFLAQGGIALPENNVAIATAIDAGVFWAVGAL